MLGRDSFKIFEEIRQVGQENEESGVKSITAKDEEGPKCRASDITGDITGDM